MTHPAHVRGHRAALLACAMTACLFLTGCPGTPPGKSKTGAGASAPAEERQSDPCDELLKSLFDVFRLEKFETTFDLTIGTNRLNDWYRGCGSTSVEQRAPQLPAGAQNLFTGAQLALLSGEQYRMRDASHLRDCILFQAIARRIANSPVSAGPSDLERAQAAFEHIMGAVQLQAKHPADLPFTAYEIYLLGKGTAADRAWLFANTLRAMRLDSVLLTPQELEDPGLSTDPVPFLVGVPCDGQLYLFDTTLGIPIPVPQTGTPRIRPATLAQVVADPQIFRQLDIGDYRYPLSGEDLKSPAVLLVGDLGYYSIQSQALQQVFSGEHSVVVSDPLEDVGTVPGLWSRLQSAGTGLWSPEAMRLWKYPQDQVVKSLALNESQQQIRKGLKLRFMAYLVIVPDPAQPDSFIIAGSKESRDPALQGLDSKDREVAGFSRTESRSTSGRQMEGRLSHLQGDLTGALKVYVEVQSNAREIVQIRQDSLKIDLGSGPIDVRLFHVLAIDDAVFWSGLCQLELGQFGPAASTFERYLRQSGRQSEWTRQARRMLAATLAAQSKLAEAIAVLSDVSEDDPEYAGVQAQIRQWKQAAP